MSDDGLQRRKVHTNPDPQSNPPLAPQASQKPEGERRKRTLWEQATDDGKEPLIAPLTHSVEDGEQEESCHESAMKSLYSIAAQDTSEMDYVHASAIAAHIRTLQAENKRLKHELAAESACGGQVYQDQAAMLKHYKTEVERLKGERDHHEYWMKRANTDRDRYRGALEEVEPKVWQLNEDLTDIFEQVLTEDWHREYGMKHEQIGVSLLDIISGVNSALTPDQKGAEDE